MSQKNVKLRTAAPAVMICKRLPPPTQAVGYHGRNGCDRFILLHLRTFGVAEMHLKVNPHTLFMLSALSVAEKWQVTLLVIDK